MKKQQEILNYLSEKGEATKSDLYKNTSYSYYLNWQKHFGDVLNRLVKKGLLIKVNRSTYAISKGTQKNIQQIESTHQLNLFNQ